jgi:hypothetical protein
VDAPTLVRWVGRRIGIETLTEEQLEFNELLAYVNEGRDVVLLELAARMSRPSMFLSSVTLEEDGGNDRKYAVPTGTNTVLRWQEVRDVTYKQPLIPFFTHTDMGDYTVYADHVILNDNVAPPGGVEADIIEQPDPIVATTAEADIGVPTVAHSAVGMYAAYLALTVNEESDARNLMAQFNSRLDQIGLLLSRFHLDEGLSLRNQFLDSYGLQYGDMIPD